MFDKMFDTVDQGIEMVQEKHGIPSDSIILCFPHDDDSVAPRFSREKWEQLSDEIKWKMIWVAHATLEAGRIWK